MNTSHTPGPWKVSGASKNASIKAVSHGSWFKIAEANCTYFTKEGNYANARLIAAAPELLAALQRLLDCPDLNFDAMEPESLTAMQAANDAIVKATV